MDSQRVLQVGVDAAKEAGAYLLQQESQIKVLSQKASHDWLLEQDQTSEKIIITKIKENFPDHSILSEESGLDKKSTQYKWIIDPLDGSFNYQHGWPLYGVIIGLFVDDLMKVSVILLPKFNELYTAIDGEGAYLNGGKIQVSTTEKLDKAVVLMGDYDVTSNKENINLQLGDAEILANSVSRVRMVGSSAIDEVLIACGKADALITRSSKSWDVEVGKKLIEEAGGVVTLRNNQHGLVSIFSNKNLHKSFTALIK